MPPKKHQSTGPRKPYKPLVSICTPTFNRRPFIESMFECFRHQTYPHDRMEWIIVDDGTDPINDLVKTANIPQIKYFRIEKKMSLGQKRNYMHTHAKGSIIVYMDDDDYYPPERVEHAVERLMSDKTVLCAGSSEMYLYFKHINKMYQLGPYGPNHATAATFAFKSRLLDDTRYEDHAALAEEKAFLKNYTIPFIQLDPMKTILVFSHNHNTFDKKKLLENMNPQFIKESSKTVEDFIKEPTIKKFFMEDIDIALTNYLEGAPEMKPDVMEQTKILDAKRKEMIEKHQPNNPIITLTQANGEQVHLTPQQVVDILQQQQSEIERLRNIVAELTKPST